jgi:P pilus assembly chaperone PapD
MHTIHQTAHLERLAFAIAFATSLWLVPTTAQAGLSVSPVVVDFAANDPPRADIDLYNDGSERLYVVIEPARIDHPGTASEQRIQTPDPQALGLLATPNRLVIEPGQHKFVRVVLLLDPGKEDRVFRVGVRPVAGPVVANASGIKILIGYDLLMIQRPANAAASVTAARAAGGLSFHNAGNTNAELFNGALCVADNKCTKLPGHRLYGGADWHIALSGTGRVTYSVRTGTKITQETF